MTTLAKATVSETLQPGSGSVILDDEGGTGAGTVAIFV
jgi:hypothetical protein